MTYRHPDRVAALIVIDGTCITADPGRLGRAELKIATPIMRAWPYGSLERASVKAAAVESSSRAYLRQRFDELSKHEYINIRDGVDRCIHPDPDYRTPGPTLLREDVRFPGGADRARGGDDRLAASNECRCDAGADPS
jgi:3-oxoadipate enol-lactonase